MDWQPLFIVSVGLMLILLASGLWIGVALGLAGLIALYLYGDPRLLNGLGMVNFHAINSFVLTAVPMFIFMGEIIMFSGLSKRLYNGINLWLRSVPGGLLQSNIAACTVFSAISGSSVAVAATVGIVAIPEMTKRGYDRKMLFGSLAGGGTLGILIPPSVSMIVYGAFTETSVAKLFMAGVVPGVLLAALFMLYILIRAKARPSLTPNEDAMKCSWKERFVSLKDILPVGFLILLVLGSIYLGWATPTEAAALGVCGALAIATLYRELSMKSMRQSLMRTVRTTCMVMLIIAGAQMFSFGLISANIPRSLTAWVVSFNITPLTFFIVITILYLVLGCFFEGISMMLLTLPVLYPLVLQLGFDPIWFGIYLVLQMELALITPPVGMNLFVIHGLAQDRPISEVISGAFPYCVILVCWLVTLAIFPGIALWLPAHMVR